jgi:hypothetical protein
MVRVCQLMDSLSVSQVSSKSVALSRHDGNGPTGLIIMSTTIVLNGETTK